MELPSWILAGSLIFFFNIIWWISDYYFGTVKIYNWKEKKKYVYLGILWIQKKKGQYSLKIPRKMTAKSFTTEYKIKSVSGFHKAKKGEKIQVVFANGYETQTILKEEMRVKNYIATSGRL